MISKILAPTDGSKTAQKAVKYAIDLTKQLNVSMIVTSVIGKRSPISRTVPASATEFKADLIVMGSHGRSAGCGDPGQRRIRRGS